LDEGRNALRRGLFDQTCHRVRERSEQAPTKSDLRVLGRIGGGSRGEGGEEGGRACVRGGGRGCSAADGRRMDDSCNSAPAPAAACPPAGENFHSASSRCCALADLAAGRRSAAAARRRPLQRRRPRVARVARVARVGASTFLFGGVATARWMPFPVAA